MEHAQTIVFILQVLLVPLVSPLVIGIIRKIKAKMQCRVGASIFQPYRNLWKLFGKDEVISEDASWVLKIAPFIIFGVTLVLAAGIPTLNSAATLKPIGDILVIIYLCALSAFFLALAGLDTGSPFGGFGGSREMTVAALAEGGFLFSLLGASLTAKATNVALMSESILSLPLSVALAPLVIACVGFLIVCLAENARYPFDNPATHLELTMIHEAMILEYSGKRLALIEWAAANKFTLFVALLGSAFFPWGMTSSLAFLPILGALAAFLVKLLVIASAVALLESSVAKIRYFRIPDLLFVSFFLGVIAIIISVIK